MEIWKMMRYAIRHKPTIGTLSVPQETLNHSSFLASFDLLSVLPWRISARRPYPCRLDVQDLPS